MPLVVKNPRDHVIVVRFEEPFNADEIVKEAHEVINAYRIKHTYSVAMWDFTEHKFDFGRFVVGLGAMRDVPSENFENIDHFFVSDNDDWALLKEALAQQQYGGYQTYMFRTMDEAMTEADKLLREKVSA